MQAFITNHLRFSLDNSATYDKDDLVQDCMLVGSTLAHNKLAEPVVQLREFGSVHPARFRQDSTGTQGLRNLALALNKQGAYRGSSAASVRTREKITTSVAATVTSTTISASRHSFITPFTCSTSFLLEGCFQRFSKGWQYPTCVLPKFFAAIRVPPCTL